MLIKLPQRKDKLFDIRAEWDLVFNPENSNPTTICEHHKYGSKEKFMSQLAINFKQFEKLSNNREDVSMIAKKLPSLSFYICQSCSFIYLCQFWRDMDNVCMKMIITTNTLFRYTSMVKYIYKHTNLWQIPVQQTSEYIKHTILNNDSDVHIVNDNLSVVRQYLRLLKRKHWKMITFQSNFISRLILFVKYIVNNKAGDGDYSQLCDMYHSSFILILYWLYYYKEWKIKYKSNSKYKGRLLKYGKEIKQLKNCINIKNPYFHYLEKIKVSKLVIDEFAWTYWKNKMLKTECFNEKCDVTKAIYKNGKFVKCSKCLAVVFCSKQCAKFDWKYGYHKQHCNKLISLRNVPKQLRNESKCGI
eukprot:302399_1